MHIRWDIFAWSNVYIGTAYKSFFILTFLIVSNILGVVSLVAVHPSTVNTIGKQLLPKTFGQSNVNIAQQVVRKVLWNLGCFSKVYVGIGNVRH